MFHLYDFLIYCFITAYTPGANNLLSMSNAIRYGFRRSIRFNLGILAGFSIVMTVCTVFSTALYSFLPKVKIVMQILGAAYMLYLAWKVRKSSSRLETDAGQDISFVSGMLLQFINPKIYIYAITAMSLYILPVFHSPAALAGFTVVLSCLGLPAALSGQCLELLSADFSPGIPGLSIRLWHFCLCTAQSLCFSENFKPGGRFRCLFPAAVPGLPAWHSETALYLPW